MFFFQCFFFFFQFFFSMLRRSRFAKCSGPACTAVVAVLVLSRDMVHAMQHGSRFICMFLSWGSPHQHHVAADAATLRPVAEDVLVRRAIERSKDCHWIQGFDCEGHRSFDDSLDPAAAFQSPSKPTAFLPKCTLMLSCSSGPTRTSTTKFLPSACTDATRTEGSVQDLFRKVVRRYHSWVHSFEICESWVWAWAEKALALIWTWRGTTSRLRRRCVVRACFQRSLSKSLQCCWISVPRNPSRSSKPSLKTNWAVSWRWCSTISTLRQSLQRPSGRCTSRRSRMRPERQSQWRCSTPLWNATSEWVWGRSSSSCDDRAWARKWWTMCRVSRFNSRMQDIHGSVMPHFSKQVVVPLPIDSMHLFCQKPGSSTPASMCTRKVLTMERLDVNLVREHTAKLLEVFADHRSMDLSNLKTWLREPPAEIARSICDLLSVEVDGESFQYLHLCQQLLSRFGQAVGCLSWTCLSTSMVSRSLVPVGISWICPWCFWYVVDRLLVLDMLIQHLYGVAIPYFHLFIHWEFLHIKEQSWIDSAASVHEACLWGRSWIHVCCSQGPGHGFSLVVEVFLLRTPSCLRQKEKRKEVPLLYGPRISKILIKVDGHQIFHNGFLFSPLRRQRALFEGWAAGGLFWRFWLSSCVWPVWARQSTCWHHRSAIDAKTLGLPGGYLAFLLIGGFISVVSSCRICRFTQCSFLQVLTHLRVTKLVPFLSEIHVMAAPLVVKLRQWSFGQVPCL